ncbi:MAG: hypothetical protein AAF849_20950 [Bacteroidota bacterium]
MTKKIKLFLASSNELKAEREQFEIEIYRKCKSWFDQGIFLHLDIWEDLSARMSSKRSQEEYNQVLREADIFVLLAYSKVGMYTAEEFEAAFGQFQSKQKPFIFTYFKDAEAIKTAASLDHFKQRLKDLNHFYAHYQDFHHLWHQFNKELDRLLAEDFKEFVKADSSKTESAAIAGKNILKDVTIGNVGGNFRVGDD